MSRYEERKAAMAETVMAIRGVLDPSVTVASLNEAKTLLMTLCERRDLFVREDFPIPNDGIDCTYLAHLESDGRYALYVNSSLPGQSSPPHDHGGAWAIVAAVEGEENHRLYREVEGDPARVEQAGELLVKPGTAVSMLPGGIHAIEANGTAPLLHLHLYALPFEDQAERRQFDLEAGTVRRFVIEDVGFVADAR